MIHRTLVDTATLAAHLDDPHWLSVDCRFDLKDTEAGRRAYHEAHLPGAHYAHLDEDLSGPITADSGRHPLPDPARFAAWLGDLGIGSDTQVVVYDACAGMIAARLWWMLRWLGHAQVALLDGGWPRWIAERRPVTVDAPDITPTTFRMEIEDTCRADTAEIVATLSDHHALIIDARAPQRYRGEVEPFDPVAGRIPGSLNWPLTDNLTAAGTFKDAAELHTHYRTLLDGCDARETVHLCGSGVTACLNILALEHAGHPGARLYPGSWSEWIRDPRRPVMRGD
jgi:thiosulfate/3-mercaptopyruvate sulfurtransferase